MISTNYGCISFNLQHASFGLQHEVTEPSFWHFCPFSQRETNSAFSWACRSAVGFTNVSAICENSSFLKQDINTICVCKRGSQMTVMKELLGGGVAKWQFVFLLISRFSIARLQTDTELWISRHQGDIKAFDCAENDFVRYYISGKYTFKI